MLGAAWCRPYLQPCHILALLSETLLNKFLRVCRHQIQNNSIRENVLLLAHTVFPPSEILLQRFLLIVVCMFARVRAYQVAFRLHGYDDLFRIDLLLFG